MMAVTKVPKKTPLVGDDVILPKVVSSFPPATLVKASPMRDIPNKKKARPPSKEIIDAMLMLIHSI